MDWTSVYKTLQFYKIIAAFSLYCHLKDECGRALMIRLA